MDKGEKGTNLAQEFGISKQQISDIRKNKDKILKFTDSIETSEGLKRVIKYSYFRLSGLFTEVPTSPDNRGSTVALSTGYRNETVKVTPGCSQFPHKNIDQVDIPACRPVWNFLHETKLFVKSLFGVIVSSLKAGIGCHAMEIRSK